METSTGEGKPMNQATDLDESKAVAKAPRVKNYWRIISFGNRIEHGGLCIGAAAAAASGVALPLMTLVFGSLINDFNNYFVPESSVTEAQFKDAVATRALYFVYLFVGKFVLSYVSLMCFRTVGLRISAALRLTYLESLFAQPQKKLDEVSMGTVANTITTSASTIQISVSDRLSALFQALALVIAAYAIAFRYSWQLTLAISSGLVFVIVVYSITTPFALKAVALVDKADEKHATVASEAIVSIRTVFALGAQAKITEKYTKWVDESHRCGMKLARWYALQLPPIYFATFCCYALAFWLGLELFRKGTIGNVGTVIIVFFSILIVTAVLGNIVQPLMNIQRAISASSAFFDIIDADPICTAGIKEPDISAAADIELRSVTFAYPTRSTVQVLKDFNAVFRKDKTTALVGPSGSGKSTVVALLERWFDLENSILEQEQAKDETRGEHSDSKAVRSLDNEVVPTPGNGAIVLDGCNINELDLKWWRAQIGLVQQEPFLFNDTIEQNVAYGLIGTERENASAEEKLEYVKDACKEAFADEFITKLPEGYSAIVGEGGIKLSGGQRQRIAIARSIIRKPKILILDEATSAIDVRGERIVQAALDRASQNRTTIIIAHRLSTIRQADHIIVLNAGQKVEEGTHEDLMLLDDGLYQGLVRAQTIEEKEHTLDESQVDSADQYHPTLSRRLSKDPTALSSLPDPGKSRFSEVDEEKALQSTAYKEKGIFGTVGILLYEQSSNWPFYVLVVLSAMGVGATYPLQSWFFANLVVAFTFVGQKLVHAQNFWALMFFILAIAVAICYAVIGWSAVTVSTSVSSYCRKNYFDNTIKMPIAYFDRQENASGSVVQRLSTDPKQLQELLGINSSFPLISIFNLIGCAILSFVFGWKLTLVVFFAVMPVVVGASFIKLRHEVQFDVAQSKVFETSSRFATEAVSAFRTVSSLTMEGVIMDKYRTLLDRQVKECTKMASYAMVLYAFADSVDFCGMALGFWYGGQLLASREYTPTQFFVIYAAIVQCSQAAGQYLSVAPNLAFATASANRILELRSRVKDIDSRDILGERGKAGSGANIEFRNVDFQYPGSSAPLFTHLNLTIKTGQFVAIVGPSGCGKTSIISLLERFYEPAVGTITFNGHDIAARDTQLYRQDLALVSQEPRLFSGTVRQNLLLGVDESAISEKQIEQACRDAEIHEFIASLPDQYATELGQGSSTALSGGQKQRLCLARALLRLPKLLLLDEATSSLDSQSEKLVQGAIERLAGKRSITVIAVAHRLATIQKADVIFVFGEADVTSNRGSKIVESGSHSALMSKRGVYWSMCQAQALDR